MYVSVRFSALSPKASILIQPVLPSAFSWSADRTGMGDELTMLPLLIDKITPESDSDLHF